jgi:hypothetical protein
LVLDENNNMVYVSFDYYFLHLSNLFFLEVWCHIHDFFYKKILFLVVIGFVMIPKTRLLLYGPNSQILGIRCDVTLKKLFIPLNVTLHVSFLVLSNLAKLGHNVGVFWG